MPLGMDSEASPAIGWNRVLRYSAMGVSGTALFSDDNAWDVRDTYLRLVGDGSTGPQATKRLLREWAELLDDAHVAPVFWLALAATQWKCGRLESKVLQQALRAIDSGSDLARWDAGSRDQKKREAVLKKLRAQLTSPQPPEKRILKPFYDSNDWKVGDLITYRLLSGRLVILRVIGHHTDNGGTSPVCELLDWVGVDLPDKSQLRALGIRKSNGHPITQFMIGRIKEKERPDDRLQHLKMNSKPAQRPMPYVVLRWSWLDKTLKEQFGLD